MTRVWGVRTCSHSSAKKGFLGVAQTSNQMVGKGSSSSIEEGKAKAHIQTCIGYKTIPPSRSFLLSPVIQREGTQWPAPSSPPPNCLQAASSVIPFSFKVPPKFSWREHKGVGWGERTDRSCTRYQGSRSRICQMCRIRAWHLPPAATSLPPPS